MPYWFDGNNLIGQSAALARSDRSTRRAFLATLSGFARTRGGRFVVFFDGDDPDRSIPPRGLDVRYSAPLSTDEAVLQRLREARTPSEVLVVTNDSSLQAHCRAAGAKPVSWTEFLSRMRTRPQNQAPVCEKEEKVDIEEWSRYFGLEGDSLK